MCYELSDFEWAAIKPFLPNKPRGVQRLAFFVSRIRRRRHRNNGQVPDGDLCRRKDCRAVRTFGSKRPDAHAPG